MCYNTLLKVTMDLGLWELIIKSSNFVKLFFKKSGQVVITFYNVSENVTKCYNRFRTLVTNYRAVQIF